MEAFSDARVRRASPVAPSGAAGSRGYDFKHNALQQMPSADAELAHFFRNLRASLRMSPYQIAAHLLTEADTIEALETADISRLPSPQETARIVMTYAAMSRIDGRGAVAAIEHLRAERKLQKTSASDPSRPGRFEAPVAVVKTSSQAAGASTVRRSRRIAIFSALPIAALIVIFNTSVLQAAVSHLPRPMMRVFHGALDFVTTSFAPLKDGFRWINVDDPRSRRGDKLK